MPTLFGSYVVKDALLIAALNAAINAAYTWYLWRHAEPLRLFGPGGIAVDLATTPVVIALLSTLLGTTVARRKLEDGRVAVRPGICAPSVLHRLPQSVIARSATLAAAAVVLLALPLLGLLPSWGDGAMTLGAAVGTKVAITVAMSLLIVPVVIWAALADAQHPRGCA